MQMRMGNLNSRTGVTRMTTPTLEQIETDIAQLSLTEQLWLMERLAHRIRHHTLRPLIVQERDLVAMAYWTVLPSLR